jgi:hypothetical protein
MSELSPTQLNRLTAATVACLAAASVLLSGCTARPEHQNETNATAEPLPNIRPCFDGPVDFSSMPGAWNKTSDDKVLQLRYDPSTKKISGEPPFPPKNSQRLISASLLVSTSALRGSGVLVEGPGHETFGLTNAHVLSGVSSVHDINIESTAGQTRPTDACYVYEVDGKLGAAVNVEPDAGSDTVDLAVLRFDSSDSVIASAEHLALASSAPIRGDWVTVTGFSAAHSTQSPGQFYGLSLNPNKVVDGVQAWRNGTATDLDKEYGGILRYTSQPGSSGSPITNQAGDLSCLLFSGAVVAPSRAELAKRGLAIDAPADSSGLSPGVSSCVTADVIEATLQQVAHG